MSAALDVENASVLANTDLFTRALLEQGAAGPFSVERHATGLHPTSLAWWLRQPGGTEPADFAGLSAIQDGPVLDVGCATGRHLEWLSSLGFDAEGIDISPQAVELAKLAGVRVTCADVWKFSVSRRYRWVVLLGNNVGIAGRLARLDVLLQRLTELLLPGGEILLSSMVPDDSEVTDQQCPPAYPGEMRLRHHYDGQVGQWFEWLYVDPDTLALHAQPFGLEMKVLAWYGATYLAVLKQSVGHDVEL